MAIPMEMSSCGELEDNERVSGKFEQLFDSCCLLFMKRFAERRITHLTVADFALIAIKCGHKELFFRRCKEVDSAEITRMLENIVRTRGWYGLRRDFCPSHVDVEIDRLESSLDNAKWLEEFMSPFFRAKESVRREICQLDFKQRIMLIREAVLNQDWPKVGAFLGHLPSFRQNVKGVPEAFRKQLSCFLDRRCRMLIPYAPAIFRTGMERFMQYDIPSEMITKSAAELLVVLIAAERKVSTVTFDVDNKSLLYVMELVIHAIANGQDREVRDLIALTSSLPSVAQKQKYSAALRAYRALYHYEQWRLKRPSDMGDISFDLADEIVAALLDVPCGEETVFIYASVHYLYSVGKVEMLLRALVDCCHKTSYMVTECYRGLLAYNMMDEASQLLDAVFPLHNIASHPIFLDWLEPRLLNLHDYDFPDEMLQNVCKLLFTFLDYGINRSSDRAWIFLWVAVQHVQDESILRSQWDLRKLWWPKFHSFEISKAGAECRSQVFKRLQALHML